MVWVFGTSLEFGDCIRKRKEYESYHQLHEESFFVVKEYIRFLLGSTCAVHTANAFNGAITAAAGVAVAVFTWTLRRTSLEQGRLTQRSVKVAERTLTDLERPYIFVSDVSSILNSEYEGDQYPFLRCTNTNHGRLPAIIGRAEYAFNWGSESVPPESIDIPPILAAGEQQKNIELSASSLEIYLTGAWDDDEQTGPWYSSWIPKDLAVAKDCPLTVRIRIFYSGPFTREHETSSLWVYDIESCCFRFCAEHEYSYIK